MAGAISDVSATLDVVGGFAGRITAIGDLRPAGGQPREGVRLRAKEEWRPPCSAKGGGRRGREGSASRRRQICTENGGCRHGRVDGLRGFRWQPLGWLGPIAEEGQGATQQFRVRLSLQGRGVK